jgi:hypothetical protein
MPKLPGSIFAEPGDRPAAPRNGKMAWLLAPLDRWLSAPGSSDPLHVSNRTLGQKLLIGTAVVAAALAIGGVIYYSQAVFHRPRTDAPQAEPSPAEIAAAMLPNMDRVHFDNAPIQLSDAHIVHGARTTLEGTARNGSSRRINGAEITFDLADPEGSKLGSVVVEIGPLEGKQQTTFRLPVPQNKAEYANVTEIRLK